MRIQTRTTKNDVESRYSTVIQVGHLEGFYLLMGKTTNEYVDDPEGWNADVYEVNADCAIVTGRKPFGNIKPDERLVRVYNRRAQPIRAFEELDILLAEFVIECKKQNNSNEK